MRVLNDEGRCENILDEARIEALEKKQGKKFDHVFNTQKEIDKFINKTNSYASFKECCFNCDFNFPSRVNPRVTPYMEFIRNTFVGKVIFRENRCINSLFSEVIFKELANFSHCTFCERTSFDNVHFKELNFLNIKFPASFTFKNITIEKADRETFQNLKHELKKQNNQIDALKYHAREMAAYEKTLKLFKNPSDKLIFWLNKWSNNHGLSWLQGVFFTVLLGAVFFTAELLLFADLSNNWQHFPKFLLPFESLNTLISPDTLISTGEQFFYYLLEAFRCIGLAYGIYQTIFAFRKFYRA